MRLARGAAIGLLLFAVLVTSAAAQSIPTTIDPQQVVERFELARGAGDVDAALAALGTTAVITVQNPTATRSFTGSTQLRAYMQYIGTRVKTVMRSRPMVQGSTVVWSERDQVDDQPVDATVVAVVSAGRIESLTYRAAQAVAAPEQLTARKPRSQPAQVPSAAWAAGLALLGFGLLGFVSGWPRHNASRSELHGRLLTELRLVHAEPRARRAA
jgi:hypothetical protein